MPKNRRALLVGATAVGAVVAALTVSSTSQAAPAAGATQNVIVLLHNQHTNVPATKGHSGRRAQILHSDQAPVVATAKKHGAGHIKQFTTVNAFAATLPTAQATALSSDPAVAAVVPDLPISKPADVPVQQAATAAPTTGPTPSSVCSTNKNKPLLEPEALQTMHVAYTNPAQIGAQHYTTGTGVKVAWIADGIDINNPDFIRANGQHVFVDYKDFSTEGPNAPSDAAEAFGDASAIAAQGRQTYNVGDYVNAAHPLPNGCYINVRGVAPGASLVGLKVFGNAPTAPTSRFIQAIDYAVNVAGVDVINESFGGNPYPDTMDDPISLADQAAMDAGVTVVSSTGDAGTTGTIGSPGTSSDMITAAGTTIFRSYAQTAQEGYNFATNFASDNISSLSSGGFAQNGKVPDVAAPGDLGWALCTPNVDIYEGCVDFNGNPASIQDFGGTSQSSPLTSGVAALVISAYLKAHPGAARPSPALVKRIITGTAQDLGHPAYEQGAGEVDALAAVRAAMTVPTEGANHGVTKSATGTALLPDKTQLDLTGHSGGTVQATVKVTNASAHGQTVAASTRSLTRTVSDVSGSFTADLSKTPTFIDELGRSRGYVVKTFTVPRNVDRLDATMAFPTADGASLGRIFLIDPHGTYQAYSIPQGLANYAHVDVRYPVAGTWKAYFQSASDPTIAFKGTVQYDFTTSRYAPLGSVSPRVQYLAPGQTGSVTVRLPVSANPGDQSASLQLATGLGHVTSVPISLRSVVAAPRHGSVRFRGVITGGNGRGIPAQTNTYYIDVPHGAPKLSVGVRLNNTVNPDDVLFAYLVAPDGQALGEDSNVRFDDSGNPQAINALQASHRSPQAGRWSFVVEQTNPVSGTKITQPFTGTVSLAAAPVSVQGTLPGHIPAGKSVSVRVRVKNTGAAPAVYFADGRLRQTGNLTLASQVPGDDLSAETLPESSVTPQWLVPTGTDRASFTANATLPVQMDASYGPGDPEVFGQSTGNTSTATATAAELAPGPWVGNVGEIGPFSGPAPSGTVALTATAHAQLFDPAVSSSTGDYWQTALIPAPADAAAAKTSLAAAHNATAHWLAAARKQAAASSGPLVLAPGASGTITVSVTPKGANGSVTRGALNIDTVDLFSGTGSEIATLPYSYTIG
jgi:hypothetical protein